MMEGKSQRTNFWGIMREFAFLSLAMEDSCLVNGFVALSLSSTGD